MRFTKHDLAIAILTEYERIKPRNANKFDVLGGRSGDRGVIEQNLNITFTLGERALAGRAVSMLLDRGQLMPTYTDLYEPDNWLVITETGERALQTGALDDLDTLLLNIHSSADLLQLRYGAYDAIAAQNTDWQRHAATSCRELIRNVLHTLSPDDEVRNDPQFHSDASASNGITRRERVKHYLRQKQGSAPQPEIAVIEKAADLIEACNIRLNAATHAEANEVDNLIKLTEDALYFLLK